MGGGGWRPCRRVGSRLGGGLEPAGVPFLTLGAERDREAHSRIGPSEGCRDFAGPLARQGASPRASLLLLGSNACGRRALSPANWTRPSGSSGQARARRLRCSCTSSMQNTGTSRAAKHSALRTCRPRPRRTRRPVRCSLSLLPPAPYCARSRPCLQHAPGPSTLCFVLLSAAAACTLEPPLCLFSPPSTLRSTSRYAEPATQRAHRLTRCDTTRAREPGEGRTARAPGRSLSSAARLIHWTREPYCRVAEVSAYQVRSPYTRPAVAMLLTEPARIPPQSEHSDCTRPDAGGTL
jgi:hypothetical protein